jgi:cysteinyl-tRNA synthetase
LLSTWSDGSEISDNAVNNITAWENKLQNLFLKAVDHAKRAPESSQNPTKDDEDILKLLALSQKDLYDALCDSFNTPLAMKIISDLVTSVNSASVSGSTIIEVSKWITKIVTIFGLDSEANAQDIQNADRIAWSGIEIPKEAQPSIYAVSKLRDSIRQQVRSHKLDYETVTTLLSTADTTPASGTAASKPYEQTLETFKENVKQLAEQKATEAQFLNLADDLRNIKLWDLGIYLEDRDDLPALVRPLDATLVNARKEKEAAAVAKAEAKRKLLADQAAKQQKLNEQAQISPLEMFRTSEYTEWDADGLPTKDNEGKEVAKSKRKKLVKMWEKQKKLFDEHKANSKA